jgi:GNAT superfamily N-acetyltransferase
MNFYLNADNFLNENNLVIRYCEPQDFTAICSLLKQLWPDVELDASALEIVYSQALSTYIQKLIVGVMNDRIVGFCSLSIKNNFWQAGKLGNVDELVVDKNYRGLGIGKKLMERISQIARENKCKRIELDSSFHRKEAHQFYERIGFKSRAYLYTKEL